MKKRYAAVAVIATLFVLAGCSGGTTAGSSEEGLLITGEIEAVDANLVASKASGAATGECIGELCGIVAVGLDGSEVAGEIDPQTLRWRLRVRAGNWTMACRNRNGERAGEIAINGMTDLAIDEVEDGEVDVGRFRYRNGCLEQLGDVEGLGCRGMRPMERHDLDFDGIPSDIDEDEPAYDDSLFTIVGIKPFDGFTHAAPCRPVKVFFNGALDDETVTAATVVVTDSEGNPIEGELEVFEDEELALYEIAFRPTGGFESGETISVTVVSGPDGVLSALGEELAADAEVSFMVTAIEVPGRLCHEPGEEYRRGCAYRFRGGDES